MFKTFEYPKIEEWAKFFANVESHWGTSHGLDLNMWAPSVAHDELACEEIAAYMRAAASPGAVLAVMRMSREIDVRNVLQLVRVPTMIAHRTEDMG